MGLERSERERKRNNINSNPVILQSGWMEEKREHVTWRVKRLVINKCGCGCLKDRETSDHAQIVIR